MGSPYDSTITASKNPPLSNPISYNTVTPNDGDGLITNIDQSKDNPLQDVVYVCLHGIDAPEISLTRRRTTLVMFLSSGWAI